MHQASWIATLGHHLRAGHADTGTLPARIAIFAAGLAAFSRVLVESMTAKPDASPSAVGRVKHTGGGSGI